MIVVEMIGPNGLRALADNLSMIGSELEVVFNDVPEGNYSQLLVDYVPAIGFRFGLRKGPFRAVIGWKPAIIEQTKL